MIPVNTQLNTIRLNDGFRLDFGHSAGDTRTIYLRLRPGQSPADVAAELCLAASLISPPPVADVTPNTVLSEILGTDYLDPPDGGSVTIVEQLRRMAQDAQTAREYPSSLQASAIPIVVLEDLFEVPTSDQTEESITELIVMAIRDAKKWRERKVPDTAHNLVTHRTAWMSAISNCSDQAEDSSYWEHELNALRATLDELTEYFGMTVPRKPLPADVIALAKRIHPVGITAANVFEVMRVISAVAES